MSGLEDILGSALGGNAISAIAAQIGTSPENAQKAVGAALPALLGQLKDNADDADKGPLLQGAIDKDHDGAALDDVNGFLSGGLAEAIGGKVLGHVFGGQKDSAAASVAKTGGIDMAQALRLLAILAPIVLGAMGRQRSRAATTLGPAALAACSAASSVVVRAAARWPASSEVSSAAVRAPAAVSVGSATFSPVRRARPPTRRAMQRQRRRPERRRPRAACSARSSAAS